MGSEVSCVEEDPSALTKSQQRKLFEVDLRLPDVHRASEVKPGVPPSLHASKNPQSTILQDPKSQMHRPISQMILSATGRVQMKHPGMLV